MEVLSRQTYIESGKSFPKLFMTAVQLAEYEGMSESHYRQIFSEIRQQVKDGRYPDGSVSDTKPASVNYYVYRDYLTNRRKLKNRNLKKTVNPFNPADVARICPLVREVVIVSET